MPASKLTSRSFARRIALSVRTTQANSRPMRGGRPQEPVIWRVLRNGFTWLLLGAASFVLGVLVVSPILNALNGPNKEPPPAPERLASTRPTEGRENAQSAEPSRREMPSTSSVSETPRRPPPVIRVIPSGQRQDDSASREEPSTRRRTRRASAERPAEPEPSTEARAPRRESGSPHRSVSESSPRERAAEAPRAAASRAERSTTSEAAAPTRRERRRTEAAPPKPSRPPQVQKSESIE